MFKVTRVIYKLFKNGLKILLGLQSSPKVQPELYNLPEEKLTLLPRNAIKDETSFRAHYLVVETSFGTVFYRHFGSNRINGKISENVTEIEPVCKADADFLHLPAPRSKEENDFWLDLAGPQVNSLHLNALLIYLFSSKTIAIYGLL